MQGSEVDRFILVATSVLLLVVSVPLIVAPEAGGAAVQSVFDFITGNLGVLYIWAAIINLVFLGWLALGRYGRVRLSNDDAPPDFSTFSWASMLFGHTLSGPTVRSSTPEFPGRSGQRHSSSSTKSV